MLNLLDNCIRASFQELGNRPIWSQEKKEANKKNEKKVLKDIKKFDKGKPSVISAI